MISRYVRLRQRLRARRAPRLFYLLEAASVVAFTLWVTSLRWSDTDYLVVGAVVGAWYVLWSEWPKRDRRRSHVDDALMGAAATFFAHEALRELRHKHGHSDADNSGPRSGL